MSIHWYTKIYEDLRVFLLHELDSVSAAVALNVVPHEVRALSDGDPLWH